MKNRRKSESCNEKDDREKRKNACSGRNNGKTNRPTELTYEAEDFRRAEK